MEHIKLSVAIAIYVDIEQMEIATMMHAMLPECMSYFMCRQKNKYPEHFDEIRKNKKELKDLTKEIENALLEKKNLMAFQSKSISAFATAITPRLTRAFSEKYSLKYSLDDLMR